MFICRTIHSILALLKLKGYDMFSRVRDDRLTKPTVKLFDHLPCVDKNGTPINPMKVNKMITKETGLLKVDNVLGYYVQLNREVNNKTKIPLILGIDLGRYYDGYTLLSRDFNFNLQDNSLEKEIKNIKNKTERKNMYKRIRRSRLRHRRWNPKENKERIQYTLNYYLQKRIFIIEKFIKYFPITDIVIEKVSHFPNSNSGSSFSMLEISQSKIVKYLESRFPNISITNSIRGFETKYERELYFGTFNSGFLSKEDLDRIRYMEDEETYNYFKSIYDKQYKKTKSIKNEDRNIENFYSHCVDSFIQSYIVLRDKYNIEFDKNKLNTNMIIKQQLKVLERRHLIQLKSLQGDKKFYKKIKKRGKIVNRENHTNGKIIKTRHKPINTNNNHIKNWEYRYQEPVERLHKFIKPYGSSKVNTKKCGEYSKFKNNLGRSKRWIRNNIYKNYEIKLIR